jgi:hypothetical protein
MQWISSVGLAARKNADFVFEALRAYGAENTLKGVLADQLSDKLGPREQYVTGKK